MNDEGDRVCPDCKQPVRSHEMFSPPRCPVVRIPYVARHRDDETWVLIDTETGLEVDSFGPGIPFRAGSPFPASQNEGSQ